MYISWAEVGEHENNTPIKQHLTFPSNLTRVLYHALKADLKVKAFLVPSLEVGEDNGVDAQG